MERPVGRGRRYAGLLVSLLLAVGMVGWSTPVARAVDNPTASISVQKSANTETVTPGQTFEYTIQVQCTAGTVNGCVNAQVTDQLPQYISLNGTVTVAGSTTDPTVDDGPPIKVSFHDDLGGGQQGLAPGNVIVITIPVVVDDSIPPTASGEQLVNTATITADNANEKSDDATVTPQVTPTLAAATTKSITPDGAPAVPGTPLTAALTGQNKSNVPVDTLVIQDPVDPTATPSPFEYLAITAPPADVTMPAGADTVQVSLYVNGAWVDGPAGPPQPAYPSGVDPADATGIRWTFASTDGADIPTGATAGAGINLVQRDNVAELTEAITVANDADTTVSTGGDAATSDPAGDTYRIRPSTVDVGAGKTFDPDTVRAGDPSTVTLTGTNNSADPLTTMTITEPAPGTPNPLGDGLTFDGIGTNDAGAGIIWPAGATEAAVTYTGPGCPGTAQTTSTVNTLPAPPAECTVTGFSVTFTGSIAPGATATIPFVVTTNSVQAQEELTRDNTVQVDGSNGTNSATNQATDSITSIIDRLDVETTKKIVPSTIPAWPGEIVTAELSGRVKPFPESTVPATTIVVQDPSTIPDPNQWYDSFDPAGVVATPVPACATGSVLYTVDGTTWLPVPGMQDVPPGIYNAPFPQNVADDAIGIRFVYTADPAGNGCSGGFPPGTSVAPNISYSLEGDVPNEAATFTDCAASAATSPTVNATSPEACDSIDVTPIDPGKIDPIDKAWDVDVLNARSQQQAGATISWSTAGFTGIGRVQITDPDGFDQALSSSVFDTFDLVRIDPITPKLDPLLTYDQIQDVRLFRLAAGSNDPGTGTWQDATNDPCPVNCDGTFPGYTLTADERATTIAFQLDYVESPTRGDRLSAGAPPVGSGVAASTGNNRQIHPVFQLRDELRSNPQVPIIADQFYNTATKGLINNTVRVDPYRRVLDRNPIATFTAADTIALVDVPVTADATKTWTGGPLGIPDPDVPQAQWPTARVTVTGTNTTPAKVDELVVADPTAPTDPFDAFNLAGFVSITPPGDIGASTLVVTLQRGGTPTSYTRDQALALTEADLADVTGFSFDYTGRINASTADPKPTATIVFDTRLRTQSRSTNQPPQPGTTVDNATTTTVSDLVGYDGVTPKSQNATAAAGIQLVAQGIDVVAGKSVNPDTLTEPATGPVTVTISGQPVAPGGGALPPSRAVRLVLTDTSTTFWNSYDLVQLNPITFVAPVDQVQVDAYTGGTWSVVGGQPVLTGGSWQLGDPTTDPNVTLPGTVTPAQVQGLRYTFTRTDGANWENPANPVQTATFQVQRRDTLHTGGPVLPDLAQNPPAPGETAPGLTTDSVTADVTSSDVDGDGNRLTASDDADATITYHHARNAVTVTKVGNSTAGSPVSPGADFPYTLTVRNSGDVPITNPVITDRLPADAGGPQVVLADDPRFSYAIAGGTGLPTDAALVTVTGTPDLATAKELRWTFPAGSTLPVGATYTITFYVKTRPGLAAGTELSNEFGVTGDRPWDACANGGTNTVDPDTGECAASTANPVLSAAAISVNKQVKAQGSDQLGVVLDPGAVTNPTCTANTAGFYARPCIPIARPGGDVTWRLEFVNVGNLPLDRILGIDRLPQPGDAVAVAPELARGSQWQPLLTGQRPELATPGAGTFAVYYTTGSNWCDQPQAVDGSLLCEDLNWVEWPAGQTLTDLGVDPAAVTGLQVELLPDTPLAPAGTVDVDVAMTAPAYSPADTPNTTASSGDPTLAFNSVGTTAHWVGGGAASYTLSTEPPRVGVGLAHGALQVEKLVSGDAADEYAPGSFTVTLSCTSAGQDVPLPPDVATLTLTADTPVTVYDLPVYAVCTLGEGDNGQSSSSAVSATVPPDGTAVLPIATLTNTYEFASLSVTKAVDSDAVDQDGNPISYGPFTVTVDCTYLDEAVYADGYGPLRPMTADLSDGQTVTFTGLPAGATCTVTETDAEGAQTTIVTTAADGTTGGETIVLTPDTDEDNNSAVVTNTFGVGRLALVKVVDGAAAPTYGAGPFTLNVSCTLGGRSVWDGDVVLGPQPTPLSAEIVDIAAGAVCTVTETDDGGASSSSLNPTEPVTIGTDNAVVTVTATNTFDPGELVLTKAVTGDAAAFAPASFAVQVTCSAGGEVLPGFPTTVDVTAGQDTVVPTLVGASCTAEETDAGGATGVTYDPAGGDGETGSGAVVVGPGDQPAITIGITNEYRSGGLQIAKEIDGPGAALATIPFVFDVSCAFNGDPAAFRTTVTLTPTAGETSLTSDVIEPLPVGAVCTVTETDSGGADSTPPPVTVTIPDVDSDGVAQVVVAGFVNPFSAGQLQVTKVLDGDDAASHTSTVFTLAVTCQYDLDGTLVTVYSGSVAVSGGQTVVVSGADGNPVLLPPGAHCFASETDTGGADASSVDYDSYDNAVIVEQGDELETLTITAVNTFNTPPAPPSPPAPPTPPVYPPIYPGGGGSLPNTGFALGQWVLLGFALLAAGVISLSVTRRRRAG